MDIVMLFIKILILQTENSIVFIRIEDVGITKALFYCQRHLLCMNNNNDKYIKFSLYRGPDRSDRPFDMLKS